MYFNEDSLSRLVDLLPSAHKILLVISPEASIDQCGSALALASALQYANKDCEIYTSQELDENLKKLQNIELIRYKLGNQTLSVSFPYAPESVDKVSYHIDENDNRFYLLIKPQKNAKPLSSSEVDFDYTGADADLIILVGIHDLSDLGEAYDHNQAFFNDTTTVSIHSFETEVGNIKLAFKDSTSFSEAMTSLIGELGLSIDSDGATNLLTGIEYSTDHFQSRSMTAESFETIAGLLRLGARRIKIDVPREKDKDVQKIEDASVKEKQSSKNLDEHSIENEVALISNNTDKTYKTKRKNPTNASTDNLAQALSKKSTNAINNSEQIGGLRYQPSGVGPSSS